MIVVCYFDRLVRSLRVQEEVPRTGRGGQVLAADIGHVSNGTSAGWLSATMLGMVSEYHRRHHRREDRARGPALGCRRQGAGSPDPRPDARRGRRGHRGRRAGAGRTRRREAAGRRSHAGRGQDVLDRERRQSLDPRHADVDGQPPADRRDRLRQAGRGPVAGGARRRDHVATGAAPHEEGSEVKQRPAAGQARRAGVRLVRSPAVGRDVEPRPLPDLQVPARQPRLPAPR